MSIYTKLGDQGHTSLNGKDYISKSEPIFDVIGAIDELNASIGIISSLCNNTYPILKSIQRDLFEIGAKMVEYMKPADLVEGCNRVASDRDYLKDKIDEMEDFIDEKDKDLPRLRNFILPGGHPAAAQAHLARCLCRKAERRMVASTNTTAFHACNIPNTRAYLNRLSDLLFIVARDINRITNYDDIIWKRDE